MTRALASAGKNCLLSTAFDPQIVCRLSWGSIFFASEAKAGAARDENEILHRLVQRNEDGCRRTPSRQVPAVWVVPMSLEGHNTPTESIVLQLMGCAGERNAARAAVNRDERDIMAKRCEELSCGVSSRWESARVNLRAAGRLHRQNVPDTM